LPDWCVKWCAARHGKQLVAAAAALLVQLIGPEMGRLDQELEKLAVYAGDAKRIDAADVDALVGFGREEKVFEIFKFIGDGQAGKALTMLDHLFEQGENPHRLLGAFGWQLRKLAQAARLTAQGSPLPAALAAVAMPPHTRADAEKQMRWLGRRRLNRLYDWLLQTDFGLKGGSALPERTVVERLVVHLARPAAAATP
jgi:DNA polymerase-3 subunit delta